MNLAGELLRTRGVLAEVLRLLRQRGVDPVAEFEEAHAARTAVEGADDAPPDLGPAPKTTRHPPGGGDMLGGMPGADIHDPVPARSDAPTLMLVMGDDLGLFLPPKLRDGGVTAAVADDSTLGHLVESAGVPLPEVGRLVVDGADVPASYRPRGGERVEVFAVTRPQAVPEPGLRFLLDVHLGALARRMRLVGLDTAYHNDCDDPVLVEQANAERRVMLSQDRGLLRRKNLWFGAYVRGTRPDAQLDDLLRRFAPPLAPWTRCTACNGLLRQVPKESVADEVEPGTLAAFDTFARCADCARVYWHGSHGSRLDEIIATAERTVEEARA